MNNLHLSAADALRKTIERREAATKRLIAALQHVDRERAIFIICSFMSIDEVEKLAEFQER
jgi:hypothetical protein